MIFKETRLRGAYIIDIDRREDDRGFFGRIWCRREFEQHGLNPALVQCSVSYNKRRATLRGMHYQAAPFQEAKLIRCTMGAIYDVIVDLREDSETYGQWTGISLTAQNRTMVYVPEGFAHGFQTLENATEVVYQMSEFYHSAAAEGIRYNDPHVDITWPLTQPILSEKDRQLPLLDAIRPETHFH
ncbi:MAG: dTDP-4-dehydrorhamnose 3,5-epimerase [Chitinivibrionales bacterium]|nr:dTDP-4-dehydrorhamnose 3,5-epimerase [Chitinivibrionales bacterium]